MMMLSDRQHILFLMSFSKNHMQDSGRMVDVSVFQNDRREGVKWGIWLLVQEESVLRHSFESLIWCNI